MYSLRRTAVMMGFLALVGGCKKASQTGDVVPSVRILDFGNVATDDNVKYLRGSFDIINHTQKAFNIEKVETSCGCVTTSAPSVVPAKGRAKIHVEVHAPSQMSGLLKKQIAVIMGDKLPPIEIAVKAELLPAMVGPAALNLGNRKHGQNLTGELSIGVLQGDSNSTSDFEIKSVDYNNSWNVRARREPKAPAAFAAIQDKYDWYVLNISGMPSNEASLGEKLIVSYGDKRSYSVFLSWLEPREFESFPRNPFLGFLMKGESAEMNLLIYGDRTSLGQGKVRARDGKFQITASTFSPTGLEVRIKFEGSKVAGPVNDTLIFESGKKLIQICNVGAAVMD